MLLKNRNSYPPICYEILRLLADKLPKHLSYHCLDHTLDVANTSNMYIEHYEIEQPSANLIRIAAVAHDLGYIESPDNHEERSISILSSILTDHNYKKKDIELINGMIRATKIPQSPTNFFEQIIADSDLDYLGRDDYENWSSRLYDEFLHFGIVSNQHQWLDAQIDFLKKHKYHTQWAIDNRVSGKLIQLECLERRRVNLS